MPVPTIVRRVTVGGFTLAVTLAALRAARRRRQHWAEDGRCHDLESTAEVVLPCSREDVYDLLRDPERLSAVLELDARTDALDGDSWVWTLPGPRGGEFVCPVEVTSSIPSMVIAWRARGAPLPHEGTARLEPVDSDSATRLLVRLRYRWSPGRARQAGVPDDSPQTVLAASLARLHAALALDTASPPP